MDAVDRGTGRLHCIEVVQQLSRTLSVPQNNLENKLTASGQKVFSSHHQEEGCLVVGTLVEAVEIGVQFVFSQQGSCMAPGDCASSCHRRRSCARDRMRHGVPGPPLRIGSEGSALLSEGCCEGAEVEDRRWAAAGEGCCDALPLGCEPAVSCVGVTRQRASWARHSAMAHSFPFGLRKAEKHHVLPPTRLVWARTMA